MEMVINGGCRWISGKRGVYTSNEKEKKMEIRKTENNNDKQRLKALVGKPVFGIRKHKRGRPACSKSAQSDQHLHYSL